VSIKDPVAVAAELNALGAKLIGGCTIGSLQFESSVCERQFLAKAVWGGGGHFSFR
jgi:hypothetical protein